jgi:capsular exopolysaccharide synthesis family protein
VWPRKQLNLSIAVLVGLFFGVALAFGLEYLDPRIARPGDIAEILGIPLLGVAPRIVGLKSRAVTLNGLSPAYEEALRTIRTRILLSPIANDARCIAVTSANPREGKTMMASNLAVSMAMAGRRVLLVDADLRRPQMHQIFNVTRSPGLSDVITGDAKPSDALRPTRTPGLFVLAAGSDAASPTDLLDSERLQQLIHGFSQVFDVILLDCPPVLAVADASIIAHAASSVLFVVRSGDTSRDAARAAVDRLVSVQAQVVGVVLNNAKVDAGSEYGYSAYVSDSARKSVTEHA